MTIDFFKRKREWSKYKDLILKYYLEPYIPKVATLKKPILIVDCFAGRGAFEDGQEGSPLIISGIVQKWRSSKKADIQAEFIEADFENFKALESSLEPYGEFATARFGTFDELLPELARRATCNTVFLYVDPYTVKGLIFNRMRRVYDQIRQSSSSVEVLLNLNAGTFMRWALAACKRWNDREASFDAGIIESAPDYQADDPTEDVELSTLDAIAGGSYWRQIALAECTFPEKIEGFAAGYMAKLREPFRYVCSYSVKEKYKHEIPKYKLMYGTRNEHGIELMNDAMFKARQEFLGAEFKSNMLFDMTPSEEIPDIDSLKEAIMGYLGSGQRTRKSLRLTAMHHHFARYSSSQLNKAIQSLLAEKRLFSSNGSTKINDRVTLSASQL